MKNLTTVLLGFSILGLSACGGSSSDDSSNQPIDNAPNATVWPIDKAAVPCVDNSANPVNWEVVLEGNAETLSAYSLFSNTCNPTVAHSDRSLPYDLSTPLFTDYATKYRFIFIPEGETASYDAKEAFDFPVGSVITKTFTMPKNTDNRVFKDELLIETRLLIRQQSGWVARAYIWNESGTEAYRSRNGGAVSITNLTHDGKKIPAFTYNVPTQKECTDCHQFTPNAGSVEFRPIGPKARFLNSDYAYQSGTENQLTQWVSSGLLTGLPPDLTTVQKAIPFNDALDLSDYGSNLTATAKSWLDINCGHCHRPEGTASNTRFHTDFNVDFDSNRPYHGVCQVPISGAGSGSTKIIVPGSPETSLLYNRLHTTTPGLVMPPVGRSLIHDEGTALIYAWIKNMSGAGSCQ